MGEKLTLIATFALAVAIFTGTAAFILKHRASAPEPPKPEPACLEWEFGIGKIGPTFICVRRAALKDTTNE